MALVQQELPETTTKLCGFSRRAFDFCICTRGGRSSVLRSASTRRTCKMEPGRGKGETNSGTRGSVFGLIHLGKCTILIGAAGAPMGNLAHQCVTFEVCSLIVLVTSRAVTVVPTVPEAVPLEISSSFSEIES